MTQFLQDVHLQMNVKNTTQMIPQHILKIFQMPTYKYSGLQFHQHLTSHRNNLKTLQLLILETMVISLDVKILMAIKEDMNSIHKRCII